MISGLYTALMIVVFLGIIAWAWSKHNAKTFEELSHMALMDDDQLSENNEENTHE